MKFFEILNEGREDKFKSKYSKKFTPEQINKIVETITPKYLEWVGKMLDPIDFENNFSKIVGGLNYFDKVSTNLPITDLNQYKTLEEFLVALNDYNNRQRREVRTVEGGNVVYEDDRYFVVNPLDYKASCYYGKGTKWCTASTESDSNFKKYNEDGKLFYIIDKKLPTSDRFYKVALLEKYEGDKLYFDAKDDRINSGWILNSDELNKIETEVNNYLNAQFPEQIKIFKDKVSAKKEKERLHRLELQRIENQRIRESDARREDNEWELNENCPSEGLKAHALLEWLVDTSDVEVKTNEDRIEIQRITDDIERKQAEYDADENVRRDLLDDIDDLEEERDELERKIDVYDIVPVGSHYDLTRFVVLNSPDLEGREYAVGDEEEIDDAARENIEQLIDDIGYEGFRPGFVRDYIDEEAVMDYARDFYDDDVNNNPEVYLDENDRQLSDSQEEQIRILKRKISQISSLIEQLEDQINDENDDIEEQIDELNDNITDIESEIEDIEGEPDGDWPSHLVEEKVDELVDNVDIEDFMNEFGLDVNDYIDKDKFIKGVIDADGYGSINSYDGNVDEVTVLKILFYIMRIE